ncbi:MAG TPA: tetratricopeptide repeat protein [Bryobacteraceae bacterium]|nr:tetratricopeptide repeat protein [Bryobacteraceae bacterium]
MRATSLFLFAALAAAQPDPLLSGLQAFHQGDYAAAERSFRQSLATGKDPRATTFLALTLAATGRCDESRPDLARTFESGETDLRRLAGLALAQCDLAQTKVEDAAAVIFKLQAQFPADADVLYEAARLHMRAWNDAIRQLYEKAPASFRVNQISAEILEIQGHYPEAAAEYRKAIEKSPATLDLHYRLGRALLLSSHEPANLEEALKQFEAELALNPRDAIAHYQVAQVLLAQHKPEDAGKRFERALELDPKFSEALVGLGKLRVDDKKYAEAIDLLQRAVKLTPNNETAHYNLMIAYRDSGNMADARREKAELDKLQKTPEGEFTDFLKKLGEKPPDK